MIKIEKKYLSFAELKDRWRITSDELHYLIQDEVVIPTIAWNHFAKACHWEPHEDSDRSYLVDTKDKIPSILSGWIFLRLPAVNGNSDYNFSYCVKDLSRNINNFEFDIWFRLLDGYNEKSTVSLGREFVEENAVFMANSIDRAELIEIDLTDSKNDVLDLKRLPSQPTYSTDLLTLLNLTVSNFFNPRHPIDAKKEAITKWIRDKGKELNIYVSDNVADSIFTIIKPNDHNPKIKRVNPQK